MFCIKKGVSRLKKFVICLMIIMALTTVTNAGFRGFPWGTSLTDIKSSEDSSLQDENDNALCYRGEVAGIECDIFYSFTDNQLTSAFYLITESASRHADYFFELKDLMDEVYGVVDTDYRWESETDHKVYKPNYNLAIATGRLTLIANWQTDTTDINLISAKTPFGVITTLMYRSMELYHLEEQARKQKEAEQREAKKKGL